MENLKPCHLCGKTPKIEHWSSGTTDCPVPVMSYPAGYNLSEVISEWNRRQR